MLNRIVLISVIAAVLVTVAGCGGVGLAKISEADNGKTIDVKAGGEIVVELAGNPSTGYTWETKDLDASLLQQDGETAFKSGNPGLIGAGGTLTQNFKAVKTGKTTLELVYHRPWETNVAPQKTFSVTIIIK